MLISFSLGYQQSTIEMTTEKPVWPAYTHDPPLDVSGSHSYHSTVALILIAKMSSLSDLYLQSKVVAYSPVDPIVLIE